MTDRASDGREDDLLTVNEYAERMRVTRRTVERWIRSGHIDAFRVGRRGHWRVRVCRILSDIQAPRLRAH